MDFQDLEFEPREGLPGIHAKAFFQNGFGASVVKGFGTYGEEAGLYELAVVKGDKDGWSLTYETPITDDVIGHLSETSVSDILQQIEALPAS